MGQHYEDFLNIEVNVIHYFPFLEIEYDFATLPTTER